jgi:ABC-2 type transport system permease protein
MSNERAATLRTGASSGATQNQMVARFLGPTMTIAKREFKSYFDSPLAYVVICLGLFLLGIFFFTGVQHAGFWQIDRTSLDRMFQLAANGLGLLIIPVVTMRLLAEEKRTGTLEMLITLPVKDSEVIMGKYLGALGLVLVLVAATVLYPLMMFKWPWHLGPLDSGPVLAGYLGLVLFCGAAVAIGLMYSSLTESQVVAFFLTFITLLLLSHMSAMGEFAPPRIGELMRTLSFDTNLANFARGMITVMCLLLAFRSLESRKWS